MVILRVTNIRENVLEIGLECKKTSIYLTTTVLPDGDIEVSNLRKNVSKIGLDCRTTSTQLTSGTYVLVHCIPMCVTYIIECNSTMVLYFVLHSILQFLINCHWTWPSHISNIHGVVILWHTLCRIIHYTSHKYMSEKWGRFMYRITHPMLI